MKIKFWKKNNVANNKSSSIIRDNSDQLAYLIVYDILAFYHTFSLDKQQRIDSFFNTNRPHEVKEEFLSMIEEYYYNVGKDIFEMNGEKVIFIHSKLKEFILRQILNTTFLPARKRNK